MVMAGLVKVASEFSVAAATSLCNSSELARLSGWSWLGLAASLGCAVYGARWGLAGVIYGVAAGWLLRGAIGAWFVRPYLRVADRPAPRTS
jgi:Na+-driven multidrug efflux pump